MFRSSGFIVMGAAVTNAAPALFFLLACLPAEALATESDRLQRSVSLLELIATSGIAGLLALLCALAGLGFILAACARLSHLRQQLARHAGDDAAAAAARMEVRSRAAALPKAAATFGLLALLAGVLGTTAGLIGSFETLAVSGGAADASALAGSLGAALVSTAIGGVAAFLLWGLYFFVRGFQEMIGPTR